MARKKIPQILTKEEQDKLLNSFNMRYPTQERNKTMIKLLIDTGLRLSEAINLRWANINGNILKVEEGKGGKDRTIGIRRSSLESLNSWRERQKEELERRGATNQNKLVFTTLKGDKLNARNIRRMVYTYAEKAGIQEEVEKHYRDEEGNKLEETYKEKKVSPHTFRHTFATELLEDTKNLRIVQEALGHGDISTTEIYLQVKNEEVVNAMVNR